MLNAVNHLHLHDEIIGTFLPIDLFFDYYHFEFFCTYISQNVRPFL